MKTSEEVKEIIQRIIDNLAKDIQKHPHFLTNEHDLKAYIYSIITKEKSCNKFVIDKENDENYLVHCEYCRGYHQNGKFKNIGFWDIAILNDQPAVDSEKGFNKYADYVLLFHLNIGKKKKG